MLTALSSPDLRKKIGFTAFILLVYRFGAYVPVPGVNVSAIQSAINNRGSSLVGLLNLFAGGALTRFSLFALGIMPYITASIVLQLLTVVIPRLEELQKEGEAGQQKITQYTRYFTVALAALQSVAYILYFRSQSGLPGLTPSKFYVILISLVAGTTLVMWLGELITQRGIGNGISLIIFANIVASIPSGVSAWLNLNPIDQIVILVIALSVVIRRPTIRFAYWIGIRRWPSLMNTTATTTESAITKITI